MKADFTALCRLQECINKITDKKLLLVLECVLNGLLNKFCPESLILPSSLDTCDLSRLVHVVKELLEIVWREAPSTILQGIYKLFYHLIFEPEVYFQVPIEESKLKPYKIIFYPKFMYSIFQQVLLNMCMRVHLEK